MALNVLIDIRNTLYQYLNTHVFLSHTEMFCPFFTQEATSLHH